MSAGTYNFTLDQGSTFNLEIIYKDSAGVVIDLTNYTAAMQIRSSFDSSATLLNLNTTNGGIVITGPQGKIELTASATATAALPSGSWVYDLEITSGSVVTRIIQGQVIVSPEVTR